MTKEVVTIILAAIIIILNIIWWITDPRPVKDRYHWMKRQLNLITNTIVAGGMILAVVLYFKNYYLFPAFEMPITYTGLIISFIGAFFASWARFYMGKFWAPAHDGHNIDYQSKLHTGGPFRYSRNPIYTGLLLAIFGFFLALNSYLIITVGLIYWYFNKSIQEEEQLLAKHFGEKYENYLQKTPKLLFR